MFLDPPHSTSQGLVAIVPATSFPSSISWFDIFNIVLDRMRTVIKFSAAVRESIHDPDTEIVDILNVELLA